MNQEQKKNFVWILFSVLVFLFLIKVFDVSYPLTVTTSSKSTELSVTGEGKVEVTGDTAFVDAGVTVSDVATVEDAQKRMNEVNNNIVAYMKKLGISKSDIKTSNYSIYPNYSSGQGEESRIKGYNGNVTISIKVKNISVVSKVIEEVTKAGANQVQGVRFTVDKPEKFREEARNKAIENAKDQAKKLAKSLGIRLGKVSNIVESSPDRVFPYAFRSAQAIEGVGGAGPQVEPGSQTITSVVTLYFEKK